MARLACTWWSREILQCTIYGCRCQAAQGNVHLAAAVSICATRDRDLLEATQYSMDYNEIWHLTKPHPAKHQYLAAEQISSNTYHFAFS